MDILSSVLTSTMNFSPMDNKLVWVITLWGLSAALAYSVRKIYEDKYRKSTTAQWQRWALLGTLISIAAFLSFIGGIVMFVSYVSRS